MSDDLRRAIFAAKSTAAGLGLAADEAMVLRDSNRFTLRLLPCDVVARAAPGTHGAAPFEVELARALADPSSCVAPLDPRVEPRVYERDGFSVTLWSFFAAEPSRDLAPEAYAAALASMHRAMLRVDVPAPRFTDRVAEAQQLVERADPAALGDVDRRLLLGIFAAVARELGRRASPEQLLHGEPHPGNVLHTASGPLFIDLETCCRGPVEFDLAHVPRAVSERYPDVDRELLEHCRALVLAMVAGWRLDPDDRLPGRQQALRELSPRSGRGLRIQRTT
jgi:hypothetical protein